MEIVNLIVGGWFFFCFCFDIICQTSKKKSLTECPAISERAFDYKPVSLPFIVGMREEWEDDGKQNIKAKGSKEWSSQPFLRFGVIFKTVIIFECCVRLFCVVFCQCASTRDIFFKFEEEKTPSTTRTSIL